MPTALVTGSPERVPDITIALKSAGFDILAAGAMSPDEAPDLEPGSVDCYVQLPVDGPVREEWSVWLQYWAEALLRPELREAHDDFYARWRETIVRIVERGRRQGRWCRTGDELDGERSRRPGSCEHLSSRRRRRWTPAAASVRVGFCRTRRRTR